MPRDVTLMPRDAVPMLRRYAARCRSTRAFVTLAAVCCVEPAQRPGGNAPRRAVAALRAICLMAAARCFSPAAAALLIFTRTYALRRRGGARRCCTPRTHDGAFYR
ncbi:hypothetical protein NPIL_582811 [Nephila pilipes]|uniref:Uncharacterized protein n=1 Tax=Nephila pilipes TaxID=299642 RepID=A0A8X6N681_NEPPI|nr:hypothetical protein NPIL_582811 [Nephila pilipes]